MKKGGYLPEHYCWGIDQGQEQKGEPLRYFHWDMARNIDQLSTEERKRIDGERRAVGMASVDRIEVQQTKNNLKNKVRW
ncbi:MAG: hypothetical protein AAGG75_10970 [Bacteroidota bacterium]